MMPWQPFVRYACFRACTNPCSNSKSDSDLDSTKLITWDQTTPFVPPVTKGQVIEVYDGDTITIATTIPIENSPMYRFSVRFLGVDAPEIKGKTEEEKQSAYYARDALKNLLLHKIVELKNVSIEKYGRLLADVYLDDLHVNQWLLDNHWVVPYDGGTKIKFVPEK